MKFLNRYFFQVMFGLLLAVFASLVVESKLVYWEGCVWHFCGITGMAFMVFFGWCMLGSALLIVRQVYWLFKVPEKRLIKKGKHATSRRRWPVRVCFKSRLTITRDYVFNDSCIYDIGMPDQLDKNKLFGLSLVFWPRVRGKKWSRNNPNCVIWFRVFGLVVVKPHHWSSVSWAWNPYINRSEINGYPFLHKEGTMHMMRPSLCTVPLNKHVTLALHLDMWLQDAFFSAKLAEDEVQQVRYPIYRFRKGLYWYLDLWFGGNRKAPQEISIKELKL